MTLTVASLFDGIGGFPLAFERAGAQTVATVEIDTAAAAISKRHFPHAHQFDDVTKVTGDDLRAVGFVPERGILTAGWPCQDFSVAGRRAGLDGARSGLWWEVVRILAEIRPTWFLGENVPGLLSSVCDPQCDGGCMAAHGGAFGAVLGSLGQLGYGVAYRVLDAQFFGVPQRRQRVFIVGHLGEPWTAPAQVLLEPESGDGDSAAGGQTWEGTPGGIAAGARAAGMHISPPLLARHAKGPTSTVDEPLIIEHTHTHTTISTLQGGGKRGYRIDAESAAGGHLIVQNGGRSVDEYANLVVQPLAVRGREDGSELEMDEPGTPAYAVRAGKVSTVAIGFHATQDPISSEERCSAIGAKSNGNGVAIPVGMRNACRTNESIVRRLTELECERLQGYPDEYTAGQTGSARYRQLGNSVAVPVVEWIARRLVAVDEELNS